MLTFDTSYSYDRISLKLLSNEVLIVKLPIALQKLPFMFVVSDNSDTDIVRTIVEWNGPIKVDVSNLPDGLYYVNLYIKGIDNNLYWPYLQQRSLSLLIANDIKHFVSSSILNENRKIM